MEELLQIGLGLFGGLALFLYGMNLMSSNLQEAAGERMRAILAAVTKNPFFGVLAGALATAVLQSSSATTVMAIGFVAAGLMGLRQAIPIIMARTSAPPSRRRSSPSNCPITCSASCSWASSSCSSPSRDR